jgi:hypothetical protein
MHVCTLYCRAVESHRSAQAHTAQAQSGETLKEVIGPPLTCVSSMRDGAKAVPVDAAEVSSEARGTPNRMSRPSEVAASTDPAPPPPAVSRHAHRSGEFT